MKYVVAKYNEDVEWCRDLNSFVVEKDVHMENVGREPASFLWYIINHYSELDGWYVFLQGNPFDHCRNVLEDCKAEPMTGFMWLGDNPHLSDEHGSPSHSGLPVKTICDSLGLDPKYPLPFVAGGQFKIKAERILFKPKDFYEEALKEMLKHEEGAWVFERIFRELFR